MKRFLALLFFWPLAFVWKKYGNLPPLEFAFDAGKKSHLEVTFEVNVYRHYIFALRFFYSDRGEMESVRNAVGSGAYKVFTKESADTDRPVLVVANNVESTIKVNKDLKFGEYVTRATDFSGQIPVQLQLFKVEQNVATKIFDGKSRALGCFGHGFSPPDGGYYDRKIEVLALRPGSYQLLIDTEDDIGRFENIQTRFVITFHPNEASLKNHG